MDMNIHVTEDNQFTNYSATSVTIKGNTYFTNILVTNNTVTSFAVSDIAKLSVTNLAEVIATQPDLIIFGSGAQIQYPKTEVLHMLQKAGIGFEVMPIQALCRTFNFLISENRKIAAILFF